MVKLGMDRCRYGMIRRWAATLFLLVVFGGVPLLIGREFAGVWRQQKKEAAQELQQSEIQGILNRVAVLGNPQKRFTELLTRVTDQSRNLKTLKRQVARLGNREGQALELYLFDVRGRLVPLPGVALPPRAAAEKFYSAVARTGPPPHPKILAAFGGNAQAAGLMGESPRVFVDLKNGSRKTFGGWWPLPLRSSRLRGGIIAFVHQEFLNPQGLLDQAVHETQRRLGNGFSLGWWAPEVTPSLRPVQTVFPVGLAEFLARLSPDQAFSRFNDRHLGTLIGEDGHGFFCLPPQDWAIPPLSPAFLLPVWVDFPALAMIGILFLLGVFFFQRNRPAISSWRLGLTAKLTLVFAYAGAFFLGTLLIMALINRQDRELVHVRDIESEHLTVLERIDAEGISELLPLFRCYEDFIREADKRSPEERWRGLPALKAFLNPRRELLEGLICLDQNGQELIFMTGDDQDPGKIKRSREVYSKMAGEILAEFGSTSSKAGGNDPNAFLSKPLAQGVYWSMRTSGKIHHQKLMNQSTVTFSDLIRDPSGQPVAVFLAMHNNRRMQTAFLRSYSRSRRRTEDFPSFFAAIPIHADARWPAFPRDSLRHEPFLAAFVDKAVSLQIPRHEFGGIGHRRFLFSGMKGSHLEDYVLIMARPESRIAENSRRLNGRLALLSLGLLILGLSTAFLTSVKLLKPLRIIATGLNAIRSRNYRSHVHATGVAELEQVSAQINNTADELRDMAIARQVQDQLRPDQPLQGNGWRIDGRCLSADDLGGDYHDWFLGENDRPLFAVGDVAGHGIPAALVTALAKVELLLVSRRTQDPATMLSHLHAAFREQTGRCRAMGLWLGIFSPHERVLHCSSGGHLFAFLISAAGVEFITNPGYPLGTRRRIDFATKTLSLPESARVVVVSDGLIEARTPTGQIVGLERFSAWLGEIASHRPDELAAAIFDRVRDWSGKEVPDDDQTLVILSLDPPAPGCPC